MGAVFHAPDLAGVDEERLALAAAVTLGGLVLGEKPQANRMVPIKRRTKTGDAIFLMAFGLKNTPLKI